MLKVSDLTVRYGELTVTDKVSFSLKAGQWLMLVGPNGAGKSTVVSSISGGTSYSGNISVLGRNAKSYRPNELAKLVGVLSQSHSVGYGYTVEEIVRLGRYAHSPGLFAGKSQADDDAVAEAISRTGLEPFLKQSVLTLSGGELQRTFLAQLFAQNPKILILDEPTNHLDLQYQKEVFELIRDWLKEPERAVISVVHDLSLAKAYGTQALLLHRGKTVSQGPISEVFSRENLHSAYSLDVYAWFKDMYGQWQ
ncbi:hemin import ATP-binding protein HmuV [Oxobacter pfennigii]|uniref:Hemin import ATP-binding protein HmuV n=1 Tax=Oxobacter pfennigii TaxID=36849 RepID=A0A0P8WW14_9CLOT|nr:ABC transporter ATP-binding protein [Oxobacter pfennigii]KPU42436.1 hemin import ATP-binding protein HmuV [Oxobacter pfennigii]